MKIGIHGPIEKRHDKVISMLYHLAPYKGSKYGIAALLRLKQKYPDLQAILFGVHEYSEAGRNVLLSPPKDVDGLVKNISYLIDHNDARIKQAQQGYQDIQRLDWNKSVDKFEAAMQEAVRKMLD